MKDSKKERYCQRRTGVEPGTEQDESKGKTHMTPHMTKACPLHADPCGRARNSGTKAGSLSTAAQRTQLCVVREALYYM